MKRGFIALFLLVLLVSPLILAAENTSNETITEEAEDVFQRKVKIRAFNFLYLIPVPSFSLDLTWVELITYLVIGVFIFIAALEVLSFTTLETAWVKVLIAAALTAIVGIFGGILALVNFFNYGLENFRLIAWAIFILILAGLLVKPIMAMSKEQKRISKAEELGTRAGAVLRSLSETGKSITKESK